MVLKRFLLVIFLSVSCSLVHAVDDNKENKLLLTGNSIEQATMLTGKKLEEMTIHSDELETVELGEEVFRWKGPMTRDEVVLMTDRRYGYIELSTVGNKEAEDYWCGFFSRGALIISPTAINCHIVSLDVRLCGLTDKHLHSLGDFKNLRCLLLPLNAIGIEGVKQIVQLEQLEVVNLNCNQLNDECLQLLSQMPNIMDLSVKVNDITDAGTIYIPENKSLKKLDIGSNKISYKRYEELKREGLEIIRY